MSTGTGCRNDWSAFSAPARDRCAGRRLNQSGAGRALLAAAAFQKATRPNKEPRRASGQCQR